MDEILNGLGRVVRALREDRGLSVTDLATRAGLSSRFVSEVQAGRGNISLLRLASLAAALGTTVSRLVAEAERDGASPRIVALLGVRGAGKSTIGPRLAARLGTDFLELDRLVEAEAGLSLAEIFATHGEQYFRRLEIVALHRLIAERRSVVLATGGGIVDSAEAWAILERHTTTVWLRASPQTHWNRVVRQGDARPMAGRPSAKAELRRLLARREPLYRRAELRVDTSRLGIDGSVGFIAGRLDAGSASRLAAADRRAPSLVS